MSSARTIQLAAVLLATVGSFSLAPVAAARTPEALATAAVEWEYRPRPRVAVDGTLWACSGDTCTGRLVDTPAAAGRACYRLARRIGRVLRFETPSGPLSEEALARCNRAGR
jgi:hypothetical protein